MAIEGRSLQAGLDNVGVKNGCNFRLDSEITATRDPSAETPKTGNLISDRSATSHLRIIDMEKGATCRQKLSITITRLGLRYIVGNVLWVAPKKRWLMKAAEHVTNGIGSLMDRYHGQPASISRSTINSRSTNGVNLIHIIPHEGTRTGFNEFNVPGGANFVGGEPHILSHTSRSVATGVPITVANYDKQQQQDAALNQVEEAYENHLTTRPNKKTIMSGDSIGGLLILLLLDKYRKSNESDKMPALILLQSALFDPNIDTSHGEDLWMPSSKLAMIERDFKFTAPDLGRLAKFLAKCGTQIDMRWGESEVLAYQNERAFEAFRENGVTVRGTKILNGVHWAEFASEHLELSFQALQIDKDAVNKFTAASKTQPLKE